MKSLKPLDFLGATLTIVGSFLPWEREGGFPGQVINGIRFYIPSFKYWISGLHEFRFYDYGGVLVLLLTSAIVLLSNRPPRSTQAYPLALTLPDW